ncbi:MAG: glycoside hydrolase family 3 C-terminal domain-containing protein [Solobacterium sp.]|nr:glycoside hydrolase family 3 C-terminal domain-containing protein [Solobacterium sp.]
MNDMSLDTSAALLCGKDNWTSREATEEGISSVRFSDGPHGLRVESGNGLGFNESHPSSAYPTASLSACSFDRELQKELGRHLGAECREAGVNVLLGPGVNHKRSPLCGRNFEYYSEDPYLTSELASGYIIGLQECGVGACVKHFAGNSREYGRMAQDSVIDERALHELYLSQFERIVRNAHPWSMMAAYNRLNGTYCCENEELLSSAKEKWGFDGAFISDWGAVADPVNSAAAGLTLEMPGGAHESDELIKEAVHRGDCTAEAIYARAKELRTLSERTSTLDSVPELHSSHAEFAQRLAEESAVLLKNNGILPFQPSDSIALIGPFARTPRMQGTGSSKVNVRNSDCLYDVMKKERAVFAYAKGYSLDHAEVDETLEAQALALAERSSRVLVITGLPEGEEAEGYDRTHMNLPYNQIHLIQELHKANRNIVVVLQCGAPVTTEWSDVCAALLCMYLSGERGGQALWNLLSGAVSPSGKLAETWPISKEQTPCDLTFRDSILRVLYKESIFSGYRYYSTAGITPAWPFGYGLSYTSFAYSDLQVSSYEDRVKVTLKLTNTGNRAGKEIVQLYIGMEKSRIARPIKELKGFEKVFLSPGEEQTITFELDERSFAYYDTKKHDWMVEAGVYQIMVGPSSEELPLCASVIRNGTLTPYSSIPLDYLTWNEQGQLDISDDAFEEVLGHPIPAEREGFPVTPSTTIYELTERGFGAVIRKLTHRILERHSFPGVSEEMVLEAPLRSILWLGDKVSWKTVYEAAALFNHKGSMWKVWKTIKKQ